MRRRPVPSFGFREFGFRVSGFGFRVPVFGFRFAGFGSSVWERHLCVGALLRRSGFVNSGFGFRVSGFGFRFSGFGFRFSVFGFRFECLGEATLRRRPPRSRPRNAPAAPPSRPLPAGALLKRETSLLITYWSESTLPSW